MERVEWGKGGFGVGWWGGWNVKMAGHEGRGSLTSGRKIKEHHARNRSHNKNNQTKKTEPQKLKLKRRGNSHEFFDLAQTQEVGGPGGEGEKSQAERVVFTG